MVDFSYQSSSRDTAISYPQSSLRYIRVTLFGAKDEEPVTVTQAKVTSHFVVPAEEATYSCSVQQNRIDKPAKTTEAVLDFGPRNLPLRRIKVECDGSDCVNDSEDSADYDHKSAFLLGADFLWTGGTAIRLGPGIQFGSTAEIEPDGSSEEYEVGSDVSVNFVLEV